MQLNELLQYDIITGAFYTLRNAKTVRRIFPNEEGYLVFYRKGQRLKLKANKVALEIVTGEKLLPGKAILHKNLDENDYRLQNLKILSKAEYNSVKEASRNLSGALRLNPHPSDVFCYVLSWKQKGVEKKIVVDDIVIAKRYYKKLQLRYAKLLNQHCIFD